MRYFIITKRTIFIAFMVVLSVTVLFAGIASEPKVTPVTNDLEKSIPIYCVGTHEKKLAITFDAAWGADDTNKLIEILKQYNAKATFFVVGDWAKKFPDSVKAFHAQGHEIANHSYSHKQYTKLSYDEIRNDIMKCNEEIKKSIGTMPTLLRAPSGAYSNDTIKAATSLSMSTIQWSVDSLDWQGLEIAEIVKRVDTAAENGSIILFHNDVKNTPEALKEILKRLSKKGFSFVTVSELIYKDNFKIDNAGKQTIVA
ncbi:MAG: polysaccharide deacetylase family protein [Oscillospiraceae bacterium]